MYNNEPTTMVVNDSMIDLINRQYDNKETIVLNEIKHNPRISAKQISTNTNIPFRTVQRQIANLKDKGIIKRSGDNRNGYWKLTN